MDCHMMVAEPEKVGSTSYISIFVNIHTTQWVDDIADAGGALYCFHLEAASKILFCPRLM